MKRAGSLSEVVQVEQELASRQSELESLVSQRDRLAEQVALATVTATFVPRGASGSPGWWTPAGDALVAAWRGLVVLVAALSPVIVLAAVAAAATLAVVRRTRRRRADAPCPENRSPDRCYAAGVPSCPNQPEQQVGLLGQFRGDLTFTLAENSAERKSGPVARSRNCCQPGSCAHVGRCTRHTCGSWSFARRAGPSSVVAV